MDILNRRTALQLSAGLALVTPHLSPVHAQGQTGRIEERLRQLGIDLPAAGPAPVANYVPTLHHHNVIYVAGQIPFKAPGELLFKGRLGAELTLEQGRASARLIGINMLALLKRHLNGDLDRVVGVLRIDGFVASANDFTQQPQVMNGISDLMVDVFGDAGRHTRTAVGVNVLPLNAPCEINAEFALRT
jgi:enamine deaminase RidA (YjgF/YER057c/UK114 family)